MDNANGETETEMEKQINGVFWVKHCGSWFGFNEQVDFVQHKDGGRFVSRHTGETVMSKFRNGLREPK